jgi:hypothetical protein
MTGRRSLAPPIAVLALFLVSVGFQGPFTYRAIENLLHATEDPRIRFLIHAPDGTLSALQPEAAGLADGDHPISFRLFTDGVSEAMNGDDEEFDEARLMDVVRSGAALNASALIGHIMAVQRLELSSQVCDASLAVK